MYIKIDEEKVNYRIELFKQQKHEFDDSMFQLCIGYLHKIASDNRYAIESKLELHRKMFLVFAVFKKYKAKDLSWDSICKIAQDISISLNIFNDFVLYIHENGFIDEISNNNLLRSYLKTNHPNYLLKKIYSVGLSSLHVLYTPTKILDFIIINANTFVCELLKEFMNESPTVRGVSAVKRFYELFEESFEDVNYAKSISSLEYFSCSTFKQQFQYFYNLEEDDCLRTLVNFYIFIGNQYSGVFKTTDEFDIYILQRANFISEYKNGAKKVLFNPFEDVPPDDIWLLDFNGFNTNSNKYSKLDRKIVDFTSISNGYYRSLAKIFFWKAQTNIVGKLQLFHYIKPFFNYISDLKSGKELSIYVKHNKHVDFKIVTLNEIMAFKTYADNLHKSISSYNSAILSAKNVLEYLHENGLIEIEQGVFYYLKSKPIKENNNTKAIPDNELKLLANLMSNKAEISYVDKLNYAIFYLALETEFRISQILNLHIDCVREASKPNEYVIKSISKTSAGNIIEQPITIYTKKHIDELIKLTQEVRSACNNHDLQKYLFISRTVRLNEYSKHKERAFNSFLKECCNELGIPEYTASNLRDTHMTKAQEYIIRNGKSDIEQSVITGHKNINTSSRHYIETKIIEMLETVYMTTIGDINIKGKIEYSLPTEIAKEENLVSNECGYCKRKNCEDYSYLDCLMCDSFVATVDRIVYFEEQIRAVDLKIKGTSIKHDREDLVNIKQLLLNYLKELFVRKEQIIDGRYS